MPVRLAPPVLLPPRRHPATLQGAPLTQRSPSHLLPRCPSSVATHLLYFRTWRPTRFRRGLDSRPRPVLTRPRRGARRESGRDLRHGYLLVAKFTSMQEDGETAHVIIQSQLISAHTSGGKTEEALATCRLGWRRILHMQLESQTKKIQKRKVNCSDAANAMIHVGRCKQKVALSTSGAMCLHQYSTLG